MASAETRNDAAGTKADQRHDDDGPKPSISVNITLHAMGIFTDPYDISVIPDETTCKEVKAKLPAAAFPVAHGHDGLAVKPPLSLIRILREDDMLGEEEVVLRSCDLLVQADCAGGGKLSRGSSHGPFHSDSDSGDARGLSRASSSRTQNHEATTSAVFFTLAISGASPEAFHRWVRGSDYRYEKEGGDPRWYGYLRDRVSETEFLQIQEAFLVYVYQCSLAEDFDTFRQLVHWNCVPKQFKAALRAYFPAELMMRIGLCY